MLSDKKKLVGVLSVIAILILSVTYISKKSINNNEIKYVSNMKAKKIIANENDEIILVGRKSCPACKELLEDIKRIELKRNIYYLDMDKEKLNTKDIKLMAKVIEKETKEYPKEIPIVLRTNKKKKVFKNYSNKKELEKFINYEDS